MWVIGQEDTLRLSEYKDKIEDYFESGSANVQSQPANYRLYEFRQDGNEGQRRLIVHSDPREESYYGSFEGEMPDGAWRGFLFVRYSEGRGMNAPYEFYPVFQSGISIRISENKCEVIGYDEEEASRFVSADKRRQSSEEANR